MATAYFSNTCGDQIYVTLNGAPMPRVLDLRSPGDGKMTLASTTYPITINMDRNVFGVSDGVVNTVKVVLTHSGQELNYTVTVDNSLITQDLYFFATFDELIGQDQIGNSGGIHITPVAK